MSIEEILKPKIEKIVQELLERGRDELLGRDYYEHYRDEEERLYRNGYSKPRRLICGCRRIALNAAETKKAL